MHQLINNLQLNLCVRASKWSIIMTNIYYYATHVLSIMF